MPSIQWFPDLMGILWGLAGGFFNCWLTKKLFVREMSNKRILAMVFLKPLVHLVIIGCGAFVSVWFMLLAAAADLLTLAVLFIKNYIDGRR